MLRNLASSLFLTERDAEFDENAPKIKGRVVTTLHKAKEVRPLVEKCITIARKSLKASRAADEFAVSADRNSSEWKAWRQSEKWQQWNNAMAPAVAARRRALQLLGDKQAVKILFEEVAPRMESRDGGYTRILRLAKPRLGDAGTQAIIEFVGRNDRVTVKSEKPAFETEADSDVTDGATQTENSDKPSEEETEAPAEEAKAAEGDESAASESDSSEDASEDKAE